MIVVTGYNNDNNDSNNINELDYNFYHIIKLIITVINDDVNVLYNTLQIITAKMVLIVKN